MEFDCKNIDIRNDELGCSLTFSDTKDQGFVDDQSIEKIIKSLGKYVMLQRSYGEDNYEEDYHYFEMSEFDNSGELRDFEIDLQPNMFLMRYKKVMIKLKLNLSEEEFRKIKEVLALIVNNRGKLNIHI